MIDDRKRPRGFEVGEGHKTATQRPKVDPLVSIIDSIAQLTSLFENYTRQIESRLGNLERKMNQLYEWFREQNPDATPIIEDQVELSQTVEVSRIVDERVVRLFQEELFLPKRDCALLDPAKGTFEERLKKEFERIDLQLAAEIDNPSFYSSISKALEVPFVSDTPPGCGAVQTTRSTKKEREDRECHFTLPIMTPSGLAEAQFYAVLDGHGGAEVVQFCLKNIQSALAQSMEALNCDGSDEEISNALKMAFVLLDSKCQKIPRGKSWIYSPGTTICLSMIVNESLYISNTGDSRAVLSTQDRDNILRLSYDFKAGDGYSHKAILKRGGRIELGRNKIPRVNGSLAITRAIGDEYLRNPISLEKAITSRPKVTKVNLDGGPAVLILATDGFWDVVTSRQAALMVMDLKGQGKSLTEIAQILAGTASVIGSMDDITVYLVDLEAQT